MHGEDIQCLPQHQTMGRPAVSPQEQNIRETGDIPPRNKPVSPPAVKKKKKKKSGGETCSVFPSSKACGGPAVSPPTVKSVEDL